MECSSCLTLNMTEYMVSTYSSAIDAILDFLLGIWDAYFWNNELFNEERAKKIKRRLWLIWENERQKQALYYFIRILRAVI